ncbi:polysaccharide pyruvyl transferase family protein [Cellulosimicrobium cellulans]|uniref:polysaccharide pyruvyl transferase family protein n=1 Tax=Cellulosimicrobium cellulans TaxID=1710 RepID=UPI00382A0BE4
MGTVETARLTEAQPLTGRDARVGIWGVFGTGNFGNEALLESLLLRVRGESIRPLVLCEGPDDVRLRHDVEAMSLGTPARTGGRFGGRMRIAGNRLRLLIRAVRTVGTLDSVVVAGSGGFERYGAGSFGPPFEIWALALACRMLRRPFVLLDVGVEVSPRRLARFFASSSGRWSAARSYRDSASRRAMESMGLASTREDPVVADLAFSLVPGDDLPSFDPRAAVVGVMEYNGRDADADEGPAATSYRRRLVELVHLLTDAGWRVVLVGGDDVDLAAARKLRGLPPAVEIVEARTPEELMAVTGSAAVTVATRFHTVVMSLLARTPVISIGYGEKHRAVLLQLGLDDTHLDVEHFVPTDVLSLVDRTARRREEIVSRIDSGVAAARGRLDAQWPHVSAVLTSRVARAHSGRRTVAG